MRKVTSFYLSCFIKPYACVALLVHVIDARPIVSYVPILTESHVLLVPGNICSQKVKIKRNLEENWLTFEVVD